MLIYCLKDPETGEIRYVGKTKRSLTHRLQQHVSQAKRGSGCHRVNWIRSILSKNLMPKIEELIKCDSDFELVETEKICIQFAKAIGIQLTNATDGGEGQSGRITSEATRKKLSAANKDKPKSDEHKIKIGASSLGNKSHTGRKHTAQTKEKMRMARLAYLSKVTNA